MSLENQPSKIKEKTPEDLRAVIRNEIDNLERSIEAETQRTNPVWPAAFNTRITVIELNLGAMKRKGYLNVDDYQKVSDRIFELKKLAAQLREQYSERSLPIPQEEKDKLIADLKSLRP